jgi:hypothetical protein
MGNENRDDLTGRVAKLERELRRWRRCGFLLAPLGVALLMGMGRAAPDLKVKSLLLVDDRDQVRASMLLNERGGVGINILSADGALRGTFGTTKNEDPFLGLYGRKDGKPFIRAHVSLLDDEAKIVLLDKDGETTFDAPRGQ